MFKLKSKEEQPLEPRYVHIEQSAATDMLGKYIYEYLKKTYNNTDQLFVVCIGTDRSTGDSLGPLVGTLLSSKGKLRYNVYGTLKDPVHAINLPQVIDDISSVAKDSFIIAIDACLGRSENIGKISLKPGPLHPGTGVNKELPSVGDIHIIGIVNVGGFMEYLVLQNTRLSLVMKMANIISDSIHYAIEKIYEEARSSSCCI
jgi:putative sporulation protein YyaC